MQYMPVIKPIESIEHDDRESLRKFSESHHPEKWGHHSNVRIFAEVIEKPAFYNQDTDAASTYVTTMEIPAPIAGTQSELRRLASQKVGNLVGALTVIL